MVFYMAEYEIGIDLRIPEFGSRMPWVLEVTTVFQGVVVGKAEFNIETEQDV